MHRLDLGHSKMKPHAITMLFLSTVLLLALNPAQSHVEFSSDMPINEEPAEGGSIDQLIVDAANSSREFQFFYDENHKFLKVEYDIVLSFDEYEAMKEANTEDDPETATGRKKRTVGLKAGGWGAKRWANNVVHFQFMSHFSGKDINTIHAAIADWEKYTCLDFRQDNGATNRIKFMNGGGCYSRLGMVGGAQDLGLAKGCRYKGIVMHEIGHALGLHHEQTRPDRDNYIRVVRSNIAPNMYYNFEKQTWKTVMQLGIPYDYTSIMHYGKTSFSTNGQLTIRTLQNQYQDTIGNRQGLSFGDIKTVNIMYNCKRHQSGCTKNDDDCPSGGFVDKNCNCVCHGGSIDSPTKACSGGGGRPPTTARPAPRTTRRPTPPRTPRPTPRPSSCQDQHRSCSWWASHGECNKNPDYMLVYCKRSCNKCGGGGSGRRVVSNCRDTHHACAQWKRMNYCNYRYPQVVRPRCKKSCGLCSSGSRDASASTATASACTDSSTLCPSWASSGECYRNPAYMLQSCRLSCGQCSGGGTASDAAVAAASRCVDSNAYCPYWKSTGQCTYNYIYMRANCKKSCGVC